MSLSFHRTVSSLHSRPSVLSSASYRTSPSSSLRKTIPFHRLSPYLAIRHHADRSDQRPRPPELDLKAQPEQMNELQQDAEIKQQQKKVHEPTKADFLQEGELSKAEQRKVNWGILKTLVKYIWPKVRFSTKLRADGRIILDFECVWWLLYHCLWGQKYAAMELFVVMAGSQCPSPLLLQGYHR